MAYIHHYCPSCRCVALTTRARCDAIQQLVRPREVQHLVTRVPWRYLPRDFDYASDVASRMGEALASRKLRYAPDPPHCDRWCSPAETLRRRAGDCDDLAILVASLLLAGGLTRVDVVVGHHCSAGVCGGHAWVEGADERGHFLIEATSGRIYDHRPPGYAAALFLRPGLCRRAA